MRLIWMGATAVLAAGGAALPVAAQGSWTPQATPSAPTPTPVYVSPSPPPSPRPSGKERAVSPISNPSDWFTEDDYPASALREEVQGTVGFRLTIDAAGNPTACAITATSGSDALDQATCSLLLTRARFNPALDRKGKPIASSWSNRFKWVLPEPEIVPGPQPFTYTMSFVVEPDGSATNCSSSDPSVDASEKGPCGKGQVFEPYRDASGQAVRRRVDMKMELTVTDPDTPQPLPRAPAPTPTSTRKKRP
jgi:protein TonB